MERPRARRSASPRESSRPAPWQELPKVSRMARAVPASTYEQRPMSPGTSTGCPTARYGRRHPRVAGPEGPGGPLAVHEHAP